MKKDKPIVLILCGGKSLRLWPLSEYKSKNFLDIFGFSPLEFTIKRFSKVTPLENIFLVTTQKEKQKIRKIKFFRRENIFYEPETKNTASAVLFSLLHLKEIFPLDKILIITPVDHLIKKEKAFYSAIKSSIKLARGGYIVTLGILPQHPTPNFGYIQVENELQKDIFSIKKFIEKPTRLEAEELIKNKNAFYNSGIFITSLDTLEKEYKKYYKFYGDFVKGFGSLEPEKKFIEIYNKIEDIPFDKAIMEKTKKVRLIKSNFFWRDFGSWQSIYELLEKDKNKNVKKANAYISGENNFIYSEDPKKKILVLGLKDVFLIDTQEYTLLSSRFALDSLKLFLKEIQ